ncbi:S-adenosyl-L-methionine-dependent methyltransferase [Lactarius indigo]|nr:S-adenosyl-L-methionine-dependent methyltransferase [Lactarius indigo]
MFSEKNGKIVGSRNIEFRLLTPCDIMSSKSESPIGFGYYMLDDTNLNSEVSRLKTQYLHFKTVFDSNTVPPEVNINHVRKVIDVATGTGAWALDFVSQPDVHDHGVQVFACDISTTKFPQAGNPDVDKITFFRHDVAQPFPHEMLGTFDLVHMSCMCGALTVQGWKLALQNLRDLLRPGGHLTLRDFDLIMFTHENPPPLEGQEPDVVAYTQGESTLATINRIFSSWALRQGFVVSLSYHLRKMLQDASLQVLSSTRALAPHGEYCLSHKGLNGTSLSEFTTSSSQSFSQVLNIVTSAMMEAGYLELGDGTRIADEEERKVLMKELRHFVERGIFVSLSEWVVTRPQRS